MLMPAEGSGLLVQVAQVCPWGGGARSSRVGLGASPKEGGPSGSPCSRAFQGLTPQLRAAQQLSR